MAARRDISHHLPPRRAMMVQQRRSRAVAVITVVAAITVGQPAVAIEKPDCSKAPTIRWAQTSDRLCEYRQCLLWWWLGMCSRFHGLWLNWSSRLRSTRRSTIPYQHLRLTSLLRASHDSADLEGGGCTNLTAIVEARSDKYGAKGEIHRPWARCCSRSADEADVVLRVPRFGLMPRRLIG